MCACAANNLHCKGGFWGFGKDCEVAVLRRPRVFESKTPQMICALFAWGCFTVIVPGSAAQVCYQHHFRVVSTKSNFSSLLRRPLVRLAHLCQIV